MPKVAHITTVHNASDNRIFYKEVISLKNAGHDICLIAPNEKDEVVEGVPVYHLKKQSSRIKRFFILSILDVLRLVLSKKIKVCHFHDPELIPVGLVVKLLGRKVVFDVHENTPAAILSKPYLSRPWLKKIMSKSIHYTEVIAFRFFDAIVTARPDISERLKAFDPITLRNFPILPRYKKEDVLNTAKNNDKFTLIFVGGISQIRGVKEVIESLSYLKDVEFWILGPFEDDKIRNECEALDGWEKVKYLGVVKPYEIFEYVKKADCGIVTFLPMPNHLTTLATKPFEYMACGLPIIMSDFKYWKDFFGESAAYTNPESPMEIAQCIDELRSSREKLSSMAEKNFYLAQNEYNWTVESAKLIDLYNKIIPNKTIA